MKKTFILLLCLFIWINSSAQLGRMLNKMADKALGNDTSNSGSTQKEPDCASESAKVVFPFEKDLKLNMTEVSVKVKNGNVLLYNKMSQNYFIKNKNSSNPEGPYLSDNPKVLAFNINEPSGDEEDTKSLASVYPEYIKSSGGKYTIQFGGKSYGPFDIIDIFMVNVSKTKFIARTSKSTGITEKEAKAMENKSQEEQMQMAMQMAQKMMQNTGGDPTALLPKYISNIPGIADVGSSMAFPNGTIKFDEFVWVTFDRITDLSGKTLLTIDRQKMNTEGDNLWLSSDNTRWATLMYGRLIFSDGKECKEIFAPYLSKENGKTVLNYMYYSPKNNAIMEVSVPF